MRVALVQSVRDELMGPLFLAEALEQAGHEVRHVLPEKRWMDRLAAFCPNVVGISVSTLDHPWALDRAKRIKRELPGPPPVVLGGAHPTFAPDIVEDPAVDAICRGEGERAFVDLLAGMRGNRLPVDTPSFWIKQNGRLYKNPRGPLIENLDDIPFPTRATLYRDYPDLARHAFPRLVTSRGCHHNCSYCSLPAYRRLYKGCGPAIRRRSVPHVMRELRHLKNAYGRFRLEFYDDMFVSDKQWLAEFAEANMSDTMVEYNCMIEASMVDEEVARLLAASGCNTACVGIETGNETRRRKLLNKQLSDEQIVRACNTLSGHGIRLLTYNMFGLPGETVEDAFETVRINQRIKPFFPYSTIYTPLPGTKLAGVCAREYGYPAEQQIEDATNTWLSQSRVPNPQADQLTNIQRFFAIMVHFPRIEPVVRQLIKLPPNKLFYGIQAAWYANLVYKRTGLDLATLTRLVYRYHSIYWQGVRKRVVDPLME
ncbi:MAG: B12-binding domain-containing radical SAM protein [Desulfatibacillaceae bacterium]